MHLTLKLETTKPAGGNFLQQQARFDDFIDCYNSERPHQALNMACPAERYVPSTRPYRGLPELDYPFHDRTVTVTTCGRICFNRQKINLSVVFAGQSVGIKQVSEEIWLVTFMHYDLGYFDTLPKPMTSNSKAAGRFGKQDFRYLIEEDAYICPAGERLAYHYTNEENGLLLHRYWTNACQSCTIKHSCTTGKERRVSRWEHEAVLETVQARLDQNPEKMAIRRQTAEHPFGTIKCWMGATHFLTKRLPKVAAEMALNVLAYNMKRVMAIIGVAGLLEALAA